MAGKRRKARILALQALYEVDSVARKPEAAIERLLAETTVSSEIGDFSSSLVEGTFKNKDEIDRIL